MDEMSAFQGPEAIFMITAFKMLLINKVVYTERSNPQKQLNQCVSSLSLLGVKNEGEISCTQFTPGR